MLKQQSHDAEPRDEDSANETLHRISEDWLAVLIGVITLAISFAAVWFGGIEKIQQNKDGAVSKTISSPLKQWLGKPTQWTANPLDSVAPKNDSGDRSMSGFMSLIGAFGTLLILFGVAVQISGNSHSFFRFAAGFGFVFCLATVAYVLSAQRVIKLCNLEYALWALMLGLIISNTVGTPNFAKPAIRTEFYIKTGLVLFGAGVLVSRLIALGLPGVFVAWVVTPIVLISTYVFGQKVLKMESRSLNLVISADMSVCGVSAAIAAAAACKAKKEELTTAIGMSLSFTVIMMFVMPTIIQFVGMSEVLGGAWMGGTIDSTGAVAAAGERLGNKALEVASTVKMIQNILIGVSAFGIATYWVTRVETKDSGVRPDIMEIWRRFPKFVVGFVLASIVFSFIHGKMENGPELVEGMIKGSTKTLRGWCFCMAFVCIGLEVRFKELRQQLHGGKPLVLYLCGQTLNLVLTLIMAWLMFEVIFKDFISETFQ